MFMHVQYLNVDKQDLFQACLDSFVQPTVRIPLSHVASISAIMKGTRQAPLLMYAGLLSVGLLFGVLTGSQIGVLREARSLAAGSENCETPEAPQVRAST